VFYTTVKEYNGLKNAHSGWTEYQYQPGISGGLKNCQHEGDYIPYAFSNYTDCDCGEVNGQPVSTTVYDSNGNAVRKTETKYKEYSLPDLPTGVRITNMCEYCSLFINGVYTSSGGFQAVLDNSNSQVTAYNEFLKDIMNFNTYALQGIYLPETTLETEYVNGQPVLVKDTQYGYASENGKPVPLIPNSVSTTNSNGDIFSKSTTFLSLANRNIRDFPTEEITLKNGDYLSIKYTWYNNSLDNSQQPIHPSDIAIKNREMSIPYDTRISFLKYDSYENPVFISSHGTNTVYLYSYNGKHPIAEIKAGAYSFAEVEAVVKSVFSVASIDTLSAMAIPNETKLKDGSLQNALPNALVTTYTYKPLVGIQTMTDPRGVVTKYDYDSFGRLIKVTQADRVIESYEYHYKN
jgi:YD repeat-containing protein